MAELERTDKPVSVLLEELGKGEVGLPEIQRGYVWNRPQARDLIDSLYREYPSGLILLWKPAESPKELRDGSFEQSGEWKLNYLVLDGQQRLTSLKQVFDGKIAVYFNVEDETFQIYNATMKANPLWVSVKDTVGKGAVKVWRKLQEMIDAGSDNVEESQLDKYLDRLSKLEKIKEYRYPVMIIHTDNYEEITESFIRINSKGTRLREAELAMAQLAFHWPGAIVREFESALDDYEQANYKFEARFLMRCFVAIGTNQSRFRYLNTLWKKSQSELESIWEHTRKAVDHTVNFLKNNAGIESATWIPSINALVPLVVYLSTKNEYLSDEETRGLLFWFLEATIHGRFTGSSETKLDQDLRAIAGPSPLNDLIGNLRRGVASFDITPEMIEGKYQRNPFLPLMFIVFRKNQAKDWFTATVLSSTNVGPDHQLELHHIFPKAVLKRANNNYESHEIDDLANIAFLSRKANRAILKSLPSKYLPNIEQPRLKAQLVPEKFWDIDKFRDFLSERRSWLARAINEYLRELGQSYLRYP